MSLMDRVQSASGSSDDCEQSHEELFCKLFSHVGTMISQANISEIEKENPARARAEIKSVCQDVFCGPSWKDVGEVEQGRLVEEVLDTVFGFGPISDLVEDDSITEIMVNGPEKIYFEREGRIYLSDKRFANEAQLRALVDRVLGPLGRRIDEASPMVNARLPQGHRVNVIISPVALNGSTLTIRKFASHLITLDEMRESGSFDSDVQLFLSWAVAVRKNIAVSGGTGSGKTTFLNALSCYIPADERVITIEDSAELRFSKGAHVVRLEARPKNVEGQGEISIRDLVINALRMRPDRIVVGECRGAEALDMLQAMNTGHDGSLTTLHANSSSEAISRLATMVRYSSDIPVAVVESYIASAVDLVIQMARGLSGERFVREISELRYDQNEHRCVTIPLYERQLGESLGVWTGFPSWIDQLASRGFATGEEVEAWKQRVRFA